MALLDDFLASNSREHMGNIIREEVEVDIESLEKKMGQKKTKLLQWWSRLA